MVRSVSAAVAGLMLAASLAPPAFALNNRTWVSGTGNDVDGCGPIATPCRSLQYAHDQTNPKGEINFKDSAGYGSVTITKGISIIADGVLAGVLTTTGGVGVTVNAGASDVVVLRGLTIEGAGVAASGVVFNSGSIFQMLNCSVMNFTANGILLKPTSGNPSFFFIDTVISRSNEGLYYFPTTGTANATIVIDRVVSTGNQFGVDLEAQASGSLRASISSSTLSGNSANGFYISGTAAKASIDLSRMDGNTNSGLYVGSGTVTIGRSSASQNNGYGINNNGGTLYTHQDNRLDGNVSGPNVGTLLNAANY